MGHNNFVAHKDQVTAREETGAVSVFRAPSNFSTATREDFCRSPDGAVMCSFAIITTDASLDMAELHGRMPVILELADWPVWLGEVPAIRHPCCTRRRPARCGSGGWIGG